MRPKLPTLITHSVIGWQAAITGTNVSNAGAITAADVDGASSTAIADTPLAGVAMAAGTYYYFIPTAGCGALDVTLRLASGTAPTITLYPVLSDGITIKGTATAVAGLVAATQATTSLTTLRGERGCILKIVAGAAFNLDQAEYSAL